MIAKQMSELLECNQDDVAAYWDLMFASSDQDKDGTVTFEEFIQFFNDLQQPHRFVSS